MRRLILVLITLLLLSSSCLAAKWEWIGSNKDIGLFIDVSSIKFDISKDINRNKVYAWIKYIYDEAYAQKQDFPANTKYAVALEGYDLLKNQSIIQRGILYSKDGEYIKDTPSNRQWEPIIPDTVGDIIRGYIAQYVPKHVEEIEQRTREN